MLSLKRSVIWSFVAVLFETGALAVIPAKHFFPHIGFLILLFTALEGGPSAGLKCGLWLGLLMEMAGGFERPGALLVLYAAAGLGCGFLRGKVFSDSLISQLCVPAAAYLALLAGHYMLAGFGENEGGRLFWNLLTGSAYVVTVVVSPFVFMWCRENLLVGRATRWKPFLS